MDNYLTVTDNAKTCTIPEPTTSYVYLNVHSVGAGYYSMKCGMLLLEFKTKALFYYLWSMKAPCWICIGLCSYDRKYLEMH